MTNWKTLFASASIVLISAASAFGDCNAIVGSQSLPDGTWLANVNGSWKSITNLDVLVADGRSHNVDFVYLVREADQTVPRRGLLVIKTAVRASTAVDRVALVREAYRPVDQCESYSPFPGGSVKGISYDNYHDYSYSADKVDQPTLTAFHVSYPRRGQGCRLSNDDTTDSYFTARWQSNRSQFSFDQRVVATGQHSQFFAQFGPAPAYASTGLSERRVEMKRYIADKSGMTCVAFSATVKPGMFIRINDLERRDGVFRAPEQSWEWPR